MRVLVLRLGHERSERTNAAIPTGTLTKKIHGHERNCVERAADDEPDGAAADRDRGPDAERLRPLRAVGEGRRDDRERCRRDERGAESLQRAEADQHPGARREPVEQRGAREDDEAEQEEPLAPEQVPDAAAEKQEAAEDERVGVHDPLEVRLGEVEVFLDRGQRDVHDRRVEHDHELGEADEHEDDPGVRRVTGHATPSESGRLSPFTVANARSMSSLDWNAMENSSLPVAERPRRPEWMKVRAPSRDGRYFDVQKLVHGLSLNTICEEARCPNIAECWGRGTATFQILGDTCTRACRYCYVNSGQPEHPPDPLEPLRLAQAAAQMELKHVVVTSVDRDDVPDRGAGHYAATIRALKASSRRRRSRS